MTTGEKIRALREEHGLTQVELAEKFGCKQCMVAQVERGSRPAPIWMVAKISELFGITTDELIK